MLSDRGSVGGAPTGQRLARSVLANVMPIHSAKPTSTAQTLSAPTLRKGEWRMEVIGARRVPSPGRSDGWRDDMDQKKHGGVVGQTWREGPIGTARSDQHAFSDDVVAQRQFLVHTIGEHS